MCSIFSFKAFVKTTALRARANIIFHTLKNPFTEIKSLFMTQRSTIDKHFKPRNSNNSRLVFICINSYIKPCVIFWHRSELRNGVGWSLLPKIWLTISAVEEKAACPGKQMTQMSGSRETDERVRADPDPVFTCTCYKSIISVTEFTSSPYHTPINVGRLYRNLTPHILQYTACTDISRR